MFLVDGGEFVTNIMEVVENIVVEESGLKEVVIPIQLPLDKFNELIKFSNADTDLSLSNMV